MTRTASLLFGLPAFLAAALFALAVGPTAGAMARALGDDGRSYCEQMGHAMPDPMPGEEAPGEMPLDLAACCVNAPEAPRDAVIPAPPPALERALVTALVALSPTPVEAPQAAPLDTGSPPGLRLHLAFSVFRV